ncbi:MAG: hypothetical protein MUE42_07830 [Opitutaceae bacterium]|jgi:hypothetical protein|nr:hypothetical protein [Opitutaceae bacterium]
MSALVRRFTFTAIVLSTLVLGAAGLTRGGGVAARPAEAAPRAAAEISRLHPRDLETLEFFRQGRGEAVVSGPGLFATDFFKPPPEPPAKPKPKPPETREIALLYRGLASFPGSDGIAYLSVDGKVQTYERGAAFPAGWTLNDFDAERAVLARGEERLTLPFNRRANLSVPLEKKP